jgi:DNA-binding MarR family transcriptional regulator
MNSLDFGIYRLYYFVYKLISLAEKKLPVAQYEDCIVFLLAKAYQRAHSAFKQKLAPFGITPVQHLILAVLAEEEFLSPAEISDRIAMDGATLSGVLDRMTEAGLIKKEENPEDRRSIRVSLTPRAKRMREDLADQRRAINEELTSRFSLEERLLLKRLLKDLKE